MEAQLCLWYSSLTSTDTLCQPVQASPHHVLLVADPQLVDPHTYPDRPWPLSSLTILYTDKYLERSYRIIQETLRPDATLFLGDLFDGGREWGDMKYASPEERYRQYGKQFWLKEYIRFSNMFLRQWPYGQTASRGEPDGRRIIASVPGNHDLGFAQGISPIVKKRFDAYFGPLNRVDMIGNHSVVSLDTVSLSAMDQVDPVTGSSGAGDGTAVATKAKKIWKPVEDFLLDASTTRSRAIRNMCRFNLGWDDPSSGQLFPSDIKSFPSPHKETDDKGPSGQYEMESSLETKKASFRDHRQDFTRRSEPETRSPEPKSLSSSGLPTIVLSHVPLYRAAGTNCGPSRERGTAIPLQAGYQYQNVLTPLISQDIMTHLHEEVTMIYSGDDHDYCEIEHNEFTGRPREITVKSMSWAMGIRIPGVQLVSLWNPIDCESIMRGEEISTPRDTIQNHLCLLPDQLGIFLRYVQAMGLTLFVITISAIRYKPNNITSTQHSYLKSDPLLPLSKSHRSHHSKSDISSTSSIRNHNSHNGDTRLSTRKSNGGYGNLPASSRTSSPSKPSYPPPFTDQARESAISSADIDDSDEEGDNWGMPPTYSRAKAKSSQGQHPRTRLKYFVSALWQVAWPVALLYIWLFSRG